MEHGYYSEAENRFVEAPRKQAFRIQVPYILRFAIIWTLFFSIIGIVIQSIRYSGLAFPDFFTSNYADWFRAFGTFTDQTLYPAASDLVLALLKDWYYFFYTGGLISLIWGILSWIIHFEVVVKKPEKRIVQEAPKPAAEEKSPIEELLERGKLALAQKRMPEADMIYLKIKSSYNPMQDANHKLYKKILDFYDELGEAKGK